MLVCFFDNSVKYTNALQNYLLIFFLLTVSFATANSINVTKSVNFLITFIKIFIFYILFVLIVNSQEKIRKMAWIIIIFLFINATITLIAQKMGMMPYRLHDFFRMGGPNEFSLILLSVLPFTFCFLENNISKSRKLFLIIAALIFLLCLTRTRSRMGFLGLLLFLGQIGWNMRKRPIFILLLVASVTFTFLNTHHGYWERVETISVDSEEHTRLVILNQAWKLMNMFPLFGVGPGNFVEGLNKFDIPGKNRDHVVHNAFLSVGAQSGILALLIYIFLMLVSLTQLVRTEKYFKIKEDFSDLLKISQATRIAFITLAFCMCFLSMEYNHFYYIFIAFSVTLRKIALENAYLEQVNLKANRPRITRRKIPCLR